MKNIDTQTIEKTLQILEEYASEKKFINYGVLYEELGIDRESPADRNAGASILAEVNRITKNKNGTMISAIVTLADEQSPAHGFFDFAIELGLFSKNGSEEEKLTFWAEQVKAIFKAYGK